MKNTTYFFLVSLVAASAINAYAETSKEGSPTVNCVPSSAPLDASCEKLGDQLNQILSAEDSTEARPAAVTSGCANPPCSPCNPKDLKRIKGMACDITGKCWAREKTILNEKAEFLGMSKNHDFASCFSQLNLDEVCPALGAQDPSKVKIKGAKISGELTSFEAPIDGQTLRFAKVQLPHTKGLPDPRYVWNVYEGKNVVGFATIDPLTHQFSKISFQGPSYVNGLDDHSYSANSYTVHSGGMTTIDLNDAFTRESLSKSVDFKNLDTLPPQSKCSSPLGSPLGIFQALHDRYDWKPKAAVISDSDYWKMIRRSAGEGGAADLIGYYEGVKVVGKEFGDMGVGLYELAKSLKTPQGRKALDDAIHAGGSKIGNAWEVCKAKNHDSRILAIPCMEGEAGYKAGTAGWKFLKEVFAWGKECSVKAKKVVWTDSLKGNASDEDAEAFGKCLGLFTARVAETMVGGKLVKVFTQKALLESNIALRLTYKSAAVAAAQLEQIPGPNSLLKKSAVDVATKTAELAAKDIAEQAGKDGVKISARDLRKYLADSTYAEVKGTKPPKMSAELEKWIQDPSHKLALDAAKKATMAPFDKIMQARAGRVLAKVPDMTAEDLAKEANATASALVQAGMKPETAEALVKRVYENPAYVGHEKEVSLLLANSVKEGIDPKEAEKLAADLVQFYGVKDIDLFDEFKDVFKDKDSFKSAQLAIAKINSTGAQDVAKIAARDVASDAAKGEASNQVPTKAEATDSLVKGSGYDPEVAKNIAVKITGTSDFKGKEAETLEVFKRLDPKTLVDASGKPDAVKINSALGVAKDLQGIYKDGTLNPAYAANVIKTWDKDSLDYLVNRVHDAKVEMGANPKLDPEVQMQKVLTDLKDHSGNKKFLGLTNEKIKEIAHLCAGAAK